MEDVLFLYDQTVEQLVRLHAFRCTKRDNFDQSGDVEDDVDTIAELLAKRDLLIFAASLRNLAEAGKAVDKMRELRLPTSVVMVPPRAPYFKQSGATLSLYQALSRIIHSRAITVCRSSFDFFLLIARTEDELYSSVKEPVINSETLIVLQTEQDPATAIELKSLIQVTCSFLNSVSEDLKITQRGSRIGE
jgi:hypothetical protein